MTHHNGMNGCLHCTEHGEVKCGAGWCRIYPARNNLPELRTSESAHLSTSNAAKTGKRVDGFFGKSVLMYSPYFSITDNIAIDYMHGILLGICKKLNYGLIERTQVSYGILVTKLR